MKAERGAWCKRLFGDSRGNNETWKAASHRVKALGFCPSIFRSTDQKQDKTKKPDKASDPEQPHSTEQGLEREKLLLVPELQRPAAAHGCGGQARRQAGAARGTSGHTSTAPLARISRSRRALGRVSALSPSTAVPAAQLDSGGTGSVALGSPRRILLPPQPQPLPEAQSPIPPFPPKHTTPTINSRAPFHSGGGFRRAGR